jgi:hypothetical protein
VPDTSATRPLVCRGVTTPEDDGPDAAAVRVAYPRCYCDVRGGDDSLEYRVIQGTHRGHLVLSGWHPEKAGAWRQAAAWAREGRIPIPGPDRRRGKGESEHD